MKPNTNYLNLKDSYLFSTVARKVAEYKSKNPGADIIRLGIGDVTCLSPGVVVEAMGKAVLEMGTRRLSEATDEQGYVLQWKQS